MDDGRDGGGWPDPATAERLLRSAGGGRCRAADPDPDPDPADARSVALLRLLAAAARGGAVDPGREQAAVAAFRVAVVGARVRRGPLRTGQLRAGRLRAGRRSVKALAGGLAAFVAVSGVAVAAGTGVLPGPFRGGAFHAGPLSAGGSGGSADGPAVPAPHTTRGPAPDPLRTADPAPSGSARPDTGPGHSSADPRPPHRPTAATPPKRPRPSTVRALCRRYAKAVGKGRKPDARVLDRLRLAAGGEGRIADYCRRVLDGLPVGTFAGQAGGSPADPSADPSPDTSADPSADPTGGPTAAPSAGAPDPSARGKPSGQAPGDTVAAR